ncbi:GNAT family N-acetyltransferase [Psychromonas sp. PT13]|uniref:GNAT family N-acetyltransferase n=1 Tax=Psychromonas sp. PT13 TaxID=3439547 RepID=UPI003EC129AA
MFKLEYCNEKQRIYNFLLKNDDCFTPPLSERINLKDYSGKLSSKGHNIFAYTEKDIGHACFYINNSDKVSFLSSICVDDNFKGKILAKTILREVELQLMLIGVKELYLEVNWLNKRAISFYTKNGYIFVDRSNRNNSSRYMFKKLNRDIY